MTSTEQRLEGALEAALNCVDELQDVICGALGIEDGDIEENEPDDDED